MNSLPSNLDMPPVVAIQSEPSSESNQNLRISFEGKPCEVLYGVQCPFLNGASRKSIDFNLANSASGMSERVKNILPLSHQADPPNTCARS